MSNRNLHKAKRNKNDEFYTQLTDIEKELSHYKEHFEGKTVLCNCDDPNKSKFVEYFSDNFEYLGLKKLLTNSGDFRSKECIELLKQADIVVTNPPFSLFRKYLGQLIEYEKKFLIIGSMNAITYKEVFPLIQNNEVWLGHNSVKGFLTPKGKIQKFGNILWYTNLEHKKRKEELILFRKYEGHEKEYPKYDNYNAIEVSRVINIPKDYDGVMGVPITFIDKYNPEQFEIIWQASGNTRASAPKEVLDRLNYQQYTEDRGGCAIINKKRTYSRILIKRRQEIIL